VSDAILALLLVAVYVLACLVTAGAALCLIARNAKPLDEDAQDGRTRRDIF
jgi:hypothetical protein